MEKVALITGITGQDGSYLAELLLSKGYDVHGIMRRSSTCHTERIDHILNDINLYYGDVTDSASLAQIVTAVQPTEVYNLAAQSQVHVSFTSPESTGEITGLGVTRLLESVRQNTPDAKFYQASSSEMYGGSPPPQNERTPFHPKSPYACSKLYAYWMVRNYRESYNMFACNGILFNHESPRRGIEFVTRKITTGIAKIIRGECNCLNLGNLDARRDWGYAREYVECMWKMLQSKFPSDYVIGTGESHSIREFLDLAFEYAGLDVDTHVVIDQNMFRPNEVPELIADPSKAREWLGWNPKVKFEELVRIMVDADVCRFQVTPTLNP